MTEQENGVEPTATAEQPALPLPAPAERAETAGATTVHVRLPPNYCPGCRYLLPAPGRERGIVKWYHRRKGYGFITRNGSADLYVNRSALRRGHLMTGELVEFAIGQNPQGLMADDVTIIESVGAL